MLNGVHRVADCLLRAFDRHLATLAPADRPDVRLLIPRGCEVDGFGSIDVAQIGHGTTQLWEQTTLPWHARDGVLVSLCNLGPILHPRHLALIHDAQFWLPEHSYPLRQRWGYRFVVPLLARSARRVMTVSNASRQVLEMARVVSPGGTGVIHNGADHVLASPPDPNALQRFGLVREGYALVFGSTKVYKNFDVVRAAFPEGMLDGLRLVVVGEDVDCEGLTHAVCTGGIDDATLRALYEGAACFLYPSRTEGFGLPPLEAMLVGCPVVAAPAGAIPEICQDTVVYADVDNPEGWATAIRILRDDAGLRHRKIGEGLARARHFTWDKAGSHLLDEVLALAAA